MATPTAVERFRFPARQRPLSVVIKGGMGVAVSSWRLASAVASRGQLGVVSGVALDSVLARRLQDGDPGGEIRIPRDLPALLDRLADHDPVRLSVDVGGDAEGSHADELDQRDLLGASLPPLVRPLFLAIVSAPTRTQIQLVRATIARRRLASRVCP